MIEKGLLTKLFSCHVVIAKTDDKIEDKKLLRMSKVRLCEQSVTLISELNSIYGHTREKIASLIISLRDNDHLNNEEIKHILLKEVKFCSRASIYNNVPEEMKRDYERFEEPETEEKANYPASWGSEDNNESQEESELDKQTERASQKTTIIDESSLPRLDTPSEYLYGLADQKTRFYFENISMTMAKAQFPLGLKMFKKLFFEV